MMSLRNEILELVSQIQPWDVLEERHIQETVAWLQGKDPIFRIEKPNVPDPHLVSYFAVVDSASQQVLLVHHKKANLWLPSGGHVEINEHPVETVRRECVEELGVQADFLFPGPFFITRTPTVGPMAIHTDVSLWYVLKGDHQTIYHFDQEEFYTVQWFSFDSIPTQTDPQMHRFMQKLKDKL